MYFLKKKMIISETFGKGIISRITLKNKDDLCNLYYTRSVSELAVWHSVPQLKSLFHLPYLLLSQFYSSLVVSCLHRLDGEKAPGRGSQKGFDDDGCLIGVVPGALAEN